MRKEENVLEIKKIDIKHATVFIEGDGDLVLCKMISRNVRSLIAKQTNTKLTTEAPNMWEDIITAVQWYKGLPEDFDTYKMCNKELYYELLKNDSPCITTFGLKKSFGDAVVRNEIDTYKTKFDNAVNVIANKGLVPITFTEASIDERLMSPKKGAPVLTYLNHFSGWKANFDIAYTDNVYSLEQIINIINLAGFGLGIGSGRSSGYGRYHVVDVK